MDRLSNNVMKKYTELSVSVYRTLIQHCNNDVSFIYNGIETHNNWKHTISHVKKKHICTYTSIT